MLHEAKTDSKDGEIEFDYDLRDNIQLGGDVHLLHLAARAHAWDRKHTLAARSRGPLVD